MKTYIKGQQLTNRPSKLQTIYTFIWGIIENKTRMTTSTSSEAFEKKDRKLKNQRKYSGQKK